MQTFKIKMKRKINAKKVKLQREMCSTCTILWACCNNFAVLVVAATADNDVDDGGICGNGGAAEHFQTPQ